MEFSKVFEETVKSLNVIGQDKQGNVVRFGLTLDGKVVSYNKNDKFDEEKIINIPRKLLKKYANKPEYSGEIKGVFNQIYEKSNQRLLKRISHWFQNEKKLESNFLKKLEEKHINLKSDQVIEKSNASDPGIENREHGFQSLNRNELHNQKRVHFNNEGKTHQVNTDWGPSIEITSDWESKWVDGYKSPDFGVRNRHKDVNESTLYNLGSEESPQYFPASQVSFNGHNTIVSEAPNSLELQKAYYQMVVDSEARVLASATTGFRVNGNDISVDTQNVQFLSPGDTLDLDIDGKKVHLSCVDEEVRSLSNEESAEYMRERDALNSYHIRQIEVSIEGKDPYIVYQVVPDFIPISAPLELAMKYISILEELTALTDSSDKPPIINCNTGKDRSMQLTLLYDLYKDLKSYAKSLQNLDQMEQVNEIESFLESIEGLEMLIDRALSLESQSIQGAAINSVNQTLIPGLTSDILNSKEARNMIYDKEWNPESDSQVIDEAGMNKREAAFKTWIKGLLYEELHIGMSDINPKDGLKIEDLHKNQEVTIEQFQSMINSQEESRAFLRKIQEVGPILLVGLGDNEDASMELQVEYKDTLKDADGNIKTTLKDSPICFDLVSEAENHGGFYEISLIDIQRPISPEIEENQNIIDTLNKKNRLTDDEEFQLLMAQVAISSLEEQPPTMQLRMPEDGDFIELATLEVQSDNFNGNSMMKLADDFLIGLKPQYIYLHDFSNITHPDEGSYPLRIFRYFSNSDSHSWYEDRCGYRSFHKEDDIIVDNDINDDPARKSIEFLATRSVKNVLSDLSKMEEDQKVLQLKQVLAEYGEDMTLREITQQLGRKIRNGEALHKKMRILLQNSVDVYKNYEGDNENIMSISSGVKEFLKYEYYRKNI